MDNSRIIKCSRIYPWFSGLSADLLFFIAIDTLWFTVVKGLSSFQILALVTLGSLFCLILQRPMLKVIEKTGNTIAVRIGIVFMLAGAVLMTFPKAFSMLALGQFFYKLGVSMKSMDSALLKNNLNLLKESDDEFIRIRNRSMTIYAVVTCVIAFVAGPMFNYNKFLPMYFCIGFCIVDFILSLFIKDYSEEFCQSEKEGSNLNKSNRSETAKNLKSEKLSPFIIICIVVLGIFTPAISSGQCNGKLFIQEEIIEFYSVEKTAFLLTFTVAISRIIRIIANVLFDWIYIRMKDRVIPLFSFLFCGSFIIMIGGSIIPATMFVKFIIMSIGYYILLAIRDPFMTYINGLILANTSKDIQQKALVYVNLVVQFMGTALNLSFTALLVKFTMLSVMVVTFVFTIIELILCLKLYHMVKWSRTSD